MAISSHPPWAAPALNDTNGYTKISILPRIYDLEMIYFIWYHIAISLVYLTKKGDKMRKKELSDGKMCTLYLDSKSKTISKEMGDGSMSRGVRRALYLADAYLRGKLTTPDRAGQETSRSTDSTPNPFV